MTGARKPPVGTDSRLTVFPTPPNLSHSAPTPLARAGAGEPFPVPPSPDTRQSASPSQEPLDEAGDPIPFGDHIRRARLSARLTQRRAAEILEITITTLSNWENGRSIPWTKDRASYLAKLQ